ncbi:hypothetical protein RRF57_012269 [Xylaria bambusicola]|uniref:Secreted protein n=1 Tax=Xylaria bambusicola TaxID=326684 RepID=A0AAN7ZAS7_9PEZI
MKRSFLLASMAAIHSWCMSSVSRAISAHASVMLVDAPSGTGTARRTSVRSESCLTSSILKYTSRILSCSVPRVEYGFFSSPVSVSEARNKNQDDRGQTYLEIDLILADEST